MKAEDKQKLIHQLFVGKVCDELGDDLTIKLLIESKQAFEENEEKKSKFKERLNEMLRREALK